MSDFRCPRLTVPCPHPRRHSSLPASNPSANLTFGSSASALGQSSDLLICRPHACVRTLWRRYYRSCRAQPPIAPGCPRLSGFMRSAFTDSRVSKPCPSRRGDSRSRPLSRSFRHLHLFVSLSALVALVGGKLVIFRQLAQSPHYRSPLHTHTTSQIASTASSAHATILRKSIIFKSSVIMPPQLPQS